MTSYAFKPNENRGNRIYQSNDTIRIFLEDGEMPIIILEDSSTSCLMEFDGTRLYFMLERDKIENKGFESSYNRDGLLSHRASVYWTSHSDTTRWLNEYYEGDMELLGLIARPYLYDGDFVIYRNESHKTLKYNNGTIIR
ncbi:MAG: hypothetical protein R2809_00310 [Flavobacteriales bacterium]